MRTGQVKWVNHEKGYRFVTPWEEEMAVFKQHLLIAVSHPASEHAEAS